MIDFEVYIEKYLAKICNINRAAVGREVDIANFQFGNEYMDGSLDMDLISDVGTMSKAEDLTGIKLRLPKTSLGVTGETKSRIGPVHIIESTNTWVTSLCSEYIWFDTKSVLKISQSLTDYAKLLIL